MIALTAATSDLDAEVDPRFGQAVHLLLVDPRTLKWESVDNPGRRAGSGAGIKVTQLLSDHRVEAVISGRFGLKAQQALEREGIAMWSCHARCTVAQAIDLWKGGKLAPGQRSKPLRYLLGRR